MRNGQYHIGGATVRRTRELDGVRAAALKVFAVFEVADAEAQLDAYISARQRTPQPRAARGDRLIDSKYELINLCGQWEYASELLYALDPNRYHDTIQTLGSDAETD